MKTIENTNKHKFLSLRKRKGIYHGEFILNFLNKNQFFIVCHTNDMHLETYLPIRRDFKNLDFKLKFIKRSTVLQFFDKVHTYELLQNVLNGSVAIIYPLREDKVHVNIFDTIETNKLDQKIIMLGFFLNDFYLISKGKKVFDNAKRYNSVAQMYDKNNEIPTINFVSKIVKTSLFFLTITSLIQKFYNLNQPWKKILPLVNLQNQKN